MLDVHFPRKGFIYLCTLCNLVRHSLIKNVMFAQNSNGVQIRKVLHCLMSGERPLNQNAKSQNLGHRIVYVNEVNSRQ